jgi:hypothetical protein
MCTDRKGGGDFCESKGRQICDKICILNCKQKKFYQNIRRPADFQILATGDKRQIAGSPRHYQQSPYFRFSK